MKLPLVTKDQWSKLVDLGFRIEDSEGKTIPERPTVALALMWLRSRGFACSSYILNYHGRYYYADGDLESGLFDSYEDAESKMLDHCIETIIREAQI